MNLEQIDHVALRCVSPEATKEWYVRTLGFERVFEDKGADSPIFLRLGSTFLALFPQKENDPPSANGRAWNMSLRAATCEDFQSAQSELQAQGVSFQFKDHEIAHSIYFFDPDGFLLGITTYDIPDGVKAGVARLTSDLRKQTSMKSIAPKKELPAAQGKELLKVLRVRFEKNMNRHKGLGWAKVEEKLESNPAKLWSLHEMERTGGEPDVVGHDKKTGEYIFFDCSAETPKGRTSVCYDREALDSRKEHKPKDCAMDMAAAMGIELLTEGEYLELQKLGEFDTKTSSWVKAPAELRKLGGGLYCDRRYGRVFVGHNGPQSYYAGRGFRGVLRV